MYIATVTVDPHHNIMLAIFKVSLHGSIDPLLDKSM